MSEGVTEKDTRTGFGIEFVGRIGTQPGKTQTTEDNRSKCIRQEGERDGCLMHESETCFDNMPMPTFRIPIMFRSMGRYSEMSYTMGREKGTKG